MGCISPHDVCEVRLPEQDVILYIQLTAVCEVLLPEQDVLYNIIETVNGCL